MSNFTQFKTEVATYIAWGYIPYVVKYRKTRKLQQNS